jgi:hypothetical protein
VLKLKIEDIKKLALDKNGEFLDTEYIDSKFKHTWRCAKRHVFKGRVLNIKRGSWCPICAGQYLDKTKIQNKVKEKKGRLISNLSDIKNNKCKFKVECDKHHSFEINWANLQNNKWCPICAKNKKKTIKQVKNYVESKKAKLKTREYINSHGLLEVECSKGHTWRINWNNLNTGKWCPVCANQGRSKQQSEVLDFVTSFGIKALEKQCILGKKEVDILIPDLNLAIEYCGLFWHAEDSLQPRLRNYHKNKQDECNQKGIRLITIFSDEWEQRNQQVKNFLKSVLGVYTNKIHARKCAVKEITLKQAKTFLEENHIQGFAPSFLYAGLWHDEQLVAVMTLGRHHRNKGSTVLNRFAVKSETHIPGAASKLLSFMKSLAKNLNINKIISWSDNRWSEGNVYSKLGFTLEKELPPDYSYIFLNNVKNRIPKQSCRKSELIKKGATGNTESEMARSLNLSKVWDCGKKRWVLDF